MPRSSEFDRYLTSHRVQSELISRPASVSTCFPLAKIERISKRAECIFDSAIVFNPTAPEHNADTGGCL